MRSTCASPRVGSERAAVAVVEREARLRGQHELQVLQSLQHVAGDGLEVVAAHPHDEVGMTGDEGVAEVPVEFVHAVVHVPRMSALRAHARVGLDLPGGEPPAERRREMRTERRRLS